VSCFERHRKLPFPRKAASGKPLCRACGLEVPLRPRSRLCDACFDTASVASSAAAARKKVEERDHGVCAECGMNTLYVTALCDPLLAEACRWQEIGESERAAQLRIIVISYLIELGFSQTVVSTAIQKWSGGIRTHLWEADHVVPVVHGGGGCGLDNLRTLCRVCHARATAQLAGLRAKTKRIQRKNTRHAERMATKQLRLLR
jgi:hypothetical protein